VRKKLYVKKTSPSQDLQRRPDLVIRDEVNLLLFLAREENHHPKIIKMYFAFEMLEDGIDTINLIFPKYPGSLEDILNERLPFNPPEFSPDSSVFRFSAINHWLWEEIVELLVGVQFLHDKLLWHNKDQSIGTGEAQAIIIGHFDLKPANILVNQQNHLIITDFGLARIKAIESRSTQTTGLEGRAGTLGYSAPESAGTEWINLSRSYDIWSMACIILEAVVFILPGNSWDPAKKEKYRVNQSRPSATADKGGKSAVESFARNRIDEGNSYHREPCFWIMDVKGKGLKTCVHRRLSALENSDDTYLSLVGETLAEMFLIDPKTRPTAEQCRQMLLQQTQIGSQELEDETELAELCGNHTARPLSRMSVMPALSAAIMAVSISIR
jgi:serine/threonine protein kinase